MPSIDVLLADGEIATVRAFRAEDAEATRDLHRRATIDSIYHRFFAIDRRSGDRYVDHLRTASPQDTVALVAEVGDQIVAVAGYECVDPSSAEVAFFVDDRMQGKGVGTVLLRGHRGSPPCDVAGLEQVVVAVARLARVSRAASPTHASWVVEGGALPDAVVVNVFGLPRRPAWFDELLADVERVFAVTGADTPGWDDPHPDRDPAEEEYSRCLNPGKYRILDARVEAWARVLDRRGLAAVADVEPERQDWLGAVRSRLEWHRVRRIVPTRPGGVTLLLATTIVDAAPFGIDVGLSRAGSPTVFLEAVPDCGCDACDSGSADLLETLDGWVLTVARGGVVHARLGQRHITRTVEGWQASGDDPQEAWLNESSLDTDGIRRWHGGPWR